MPLTHMNASLKRMYLGAIGLLIAAPVATHAETLQQVTDQGNLTTNPIVFSGGTSTNLFEVSGLKLTGATGYGDFGGYPTKILISSPNGNYWNDIYQNLEADANSASPAQWGHYVSDEGDFQFWSVNGPAGGAHQYLTFVTPEQEAAWSTGGPGGVYMPEAGMTFSPFQSNTNDLGLPFAAWRNLYVGGVQFSVAAGTGLTVQGLTAATGTISTFKSGTIEVNGPSGIGSFGGYPAKTVITVPTEGMWTQVEQNTQANVDHPTTAETWGSFIGNDGSYNFYAVNSGQGFMQYVTEAQLVEGGVTDGVGGVYVGPTNGTLSPWQNNNVDLGLPSDSWKNVYASGTIFTVGLNASSQVRLPSDTLINNTAVCLQDGTNCPSSFSAFSAISAPNTDADGHSTLAKNTLSINVSFPSAFGSAPAVVITPREFIDGAYRVTNVNANGFKIEVSKKQSKNVRFDWHASEVE